jgi:hypothetical protein
VSHATYNLLDHIAKQRNSFPVAEHTYSMRGHQSGVWIGVPYIPIIDCVSPLISSFSFPRFGNNSLNADHSYRQYIAVAPFPSGSFSPDIGCKVPRPSYGCIQIWTLSPTRAIELQVDKNGHEQTPADVGDMRCEMVLCLDGGPAHEIRWCPLPSHDVVSTGKQCTSNVLVDFQQDLRTSEHGTTAQARYHCRNVSRWFSFALCGS